MPMLPQFRIAHGETRSRSRHDRGRGIHVAVSVAKLAQLPEQPSIPRQPQGELLAQSPPHRPAASCSARGQLAWLILIIASTKTYTKEIIQSSSLSLGEEGWG